MNFKKRLKFFTVLSVIGIIYLDGRFVGKFFNKIYKQSFTERGIVNIQRPVPEDSFQIMVLNRKILSDLESPEVLVLKDRVSYSNACTFPSQEKLKGNLTIKEEVSDLLGILLTFKTLKSITKM